MKLETNTQHRNAELKWSQGYLPMKRINQLFPEKVDRPQVGLYPHFAIIAK